MPKFPLLIEARPKLVKQSASVPLGGGRWRVTANHVDTKLTVSDGSLHLLPQGGEVIIEGPVIVTILITEAGNESGISAFAELINDLGTG